MTRSKLTRISVENFKSIGERQDLNLSDVTVLIGANGSGKSNLLSVFRLLNYNSTGALQEYVSKSGAGSFTHYGTFANITILFYFESESHQNQYTLKLMPQLTNEILIHSEELVTQSRTAKGRRVDLISTFVSESHLKRDVLSGNDPNKVNKKAFYAILSGIRYFNFHDTSIESNIKKPSYVNGNPRLMHDGGNASAFLFWLKSSENTYPFYERIIKFIRMAYPQFHDFVLDPDRNQYNRLDFKDTAGPDGYVLSPFQLSDGTLRFTCLATLLLQPKETIPNVIVLDEPELGLHPTAISLLANMIFTAVENCQVILATQSPLLLDYFDIGQIRTIERKGKETVVNQPNAEELSEWLKEYSPGEIWQKNLIGAKP